MLRAKLSTAYRRLYSYRVERSTGVICDQTIVLTGLKTKQAYPNQFRRVKFHDQERNKTLDFVTNQTTLPALTIALLHRSRWQVELYFKWTKQHLRIKTFFSVRENTVKPQIWIAVSVYVSIAIIKKRLNLDASLFTILQTLSLIMFEKTPIYQLLGKSVYTSDNLKYLNQFKLFV